MPFCQHCGAQSHAADRFCANCGAGLTAPPAAPGPAGGPAGAQAISGPAIAVTPKDLGAILGETLLVYRSHLPTFLVLSLIPQMAVMAMSLSQPSFESFGGVPGDPPPTPEQLAALLGQSFFFLTAAVAAGLISLVFMGASINAVGQHYQSQRVDIAAALRSGLRRFINLLLAGILVVLILIIPALLSIVLVGIPVLLFLLVRLYFSAQAIVLENLGPMDAISRSWNVVGGQWWRTFGTGAVFVLISSPIWAAIFFVGTPQFWFASPMVSSLISALLSTVVGPFFTIGSTIVYLDLRARREGPTLAIAP